MSHGVIEDYSEVMEWKIPEFFALFKIKDVIDSPQFSLAGCTCCVRLQNEYGFLVPYLLFYKRFPKTDGHREFNFGLKTKDGIIKETLFCLFKAGRPKLWNLTDLQANKSLVPSGTLTITLRMVRVAPAPEQIAQEVNFSTKTFVELEDLSSDLQDLLNSEKTCDFTVNVQGKEFRVHRSLLAARSSVFRAMLEHDTAEAKSGVLNIPDCHPESFQEFIDFLYTGKIEEVTFELAYHLYSTAEKYDVQRLKSLCCSYLGQNLSADNVCKAVILADKFCDEKLQSSAQDFFNKNSMQIFLTSDWEAMMKDYFRIFNKVLKEMASASLKNS